MEKESYAPKFRIPSPKPPDYNIHKVTDVINFGSNQWDLRKLAGVVPPDVIEAISSILPIPLIYRPDQLVWHFNSNGDYSVKSGYHIGVAHNSVLISLLKEKPLSSFQPNKGLWKVVWSMKVVNKVESFWWRERVTIFWRPRKIYSNVGATPPTYAPFVRKEVEMVEHTLFFYSWVRPVWFGCNIQVLGDLGGNSSTVKWASEIVDSLTEGRYSKVNPVTTLAAINHGSMEFSKLLVRSSVQMDNPIDQGATTTWRAPDFGKFKVNCDVAIPPNSSSSTMAVVLRNWRGEVLDGFARKVYARTSLRGELLAIQAVCELAVSLGIKGVEMESDNENEKAISLSVSELVPPWDSRAVIMDIQ
ncbi:uncharacterized protein LOC131299883 [Rhododendron vialii]|uniref:uncharacterized protein LOC131299883 n=1 Tax=Rhododendron vialii TaxID=182163 RepID=UPI00265D714A|nr:uncharacterized protein LOC131299883 [Rhododendron vialii]